MATKKFAVVEKQKKSHHKQLDTEDDTFKEKIVGKHKMRMFSNILLRIWGVFKSIQTRAWNRNRKPESSAIFAEPKLNLNLKNLTLINPNLNYS